MVMPRLTSALEATFSMAGGIQVVNGLLVGDASLSSMDAGPAVTVPVWLISLLIGGSLSLLGYLLKRALDQLDSKLGRMDAKLEEAAANREAMDRRLAVVETKVDAISHR